MKEVDKTIVTTDDAITYQLIITSSEENIPKPQLPKFTGFKIISSALVTTVSFTPPLSRGAGCNVKTIAVYAFVLVPTDIGRLRIEPSSIKIKNETYSTGTLEIEVKQAKLKPKTEPGQRPSIPEETQPEIEQPPQITL